jgi:hypothetical protein
VKGCLDWIRSYIWLVFLFRDMSRMRGGGVTQDDDYDDLEDNRNMHTEGTARQLDKFTTPNVKQPIVGPKTVAAGPGVSKILVGTVVQSPEAIAHLYSESKEDAECDQDSEQSLKWQEFLDIVSPSQEKGQALLRAMELVDEPLDSSQEKLGEIMSGDAYITLAEEIDKELTPIMGSCDNKNMKGKETLLRDDQVAKGAKILQAFEMADEEDVLPKTGVEEKSVLSDEVLQ